MLNFQVGDKVLISNEYEVKHAAERNNSILPGTTVTIEELISNDSDSEHYQVLTEKGYRWYLSDDDLVEVVENKPDVQYTGGSSNYYKVFVQNPTTLAEPYEAECNDIIEALKMTFAEGNAFKAIWRKAKARQGVQKKGYDNGLYDSEKVVFFGERMVVEAKSGEGN